jgi:uncharacterized membrane protein
MTGSSAIDAPAATKTQRRAALGAAAAILIVGALVRIPPLFHDFWLDEAWSYLLVEERVDKPIDILTRLHVDNNHPLNSFFLYLGGNSRDWWLFRIPAWIAGVGCIVLAGLVMRRFGQTQALCSMLLVACSYPLIVYSTEARGYAPMLFFALLSVEAAATWTRSQRMLSCTVFWFAVIFGFLSHLTFIHCYGAVLVFSAAELARNVPSRWSRVRKLSLLHGPPLGFLCGYYWIFVRHLSVAGAETRSLVETIVETMTMTAGAPNSGVLAAVGVMAVVILLSVGLHRLREASTSWFLLFLFGIVVVPLPLVMGRIALSREPVPVFPRYFLVSITLFLLLLGFLARNAFQGNVRRRLAYVVPAALLLVGNACQTGRFIIDGRGRYLEAVRYLAQHDARSQIRITSNSGFRTTVLLSFYSRSLPAGRRILYIPQDGKRRNVAPNWWILEILDPNAKAPRALQTRENRFELRRQFRFFGPSGCRWAVYERRGQASKEDAQ